MTDQTLAEVLSEYDRAPTKPLTERAVEHAIKTLRSPNDKSDPTFEWRAEITAFQFSDRELGNNSPWDTHFTPESWWRNNDGSLGGMPDITSINEAMLNYWSQRAAITKHPVLRARYSGLAWDLSRVVIKKSGNPDMARVRIDAVVETATTNAHGEPLNVYQMLAHALSIALKLNDQPRIDRVRDALIEHEHRVAEDSLPGLWGYAFDLLFTNKKVTLTPQQQKRIIEDLENRLQRISDPDTPATLHPWAAEAAAQRLADHYRRAEQPKEARRVLLKVGRAFGHLAEQADPMVGQAWLRQVHDLYRNFGLNDEASELRKRIRELGPAAQERMVPHTSTVEIKHEEKDRYVDGMLEGGLEDARKRFILHNIPTREDIEQQLQELAQEAPIAFLMMRTIVDYKGRPVAHVGSLEDDLDGHVVLQITQDIGFHGIWVRWVIEAMIERYGLDAAKVLHWTSESPLFDPDKLAILERGLRAYFEGDAMLALHFLVPQVEDAVRTLLEMAGGDVYKPNRLGGMDLRQFDDILRDDIVVQNLTPDVADYFRVLYTDRRGWNLRNNLCHGMMPTDTLGMQLADRVLHTIMLLSVLRATEKAAV